MKKHSLAVLLAVCFILLFCVTSLAADISETLECGKEYSSVSLSPIVSQEKLDLISVSPESQNGISLICSIAENRESISISYSGIPEKKGTYVFEITYTEGEGDTKITKTCSVTFNVNEAKPVTADKPVITDKSPRETLLTVKQTDQPITFSVSATGNGTLTYKWLLDGTEVSTDQSYVFVPYSLEVGEHKLQCRLTNSINDYSAESGSDSPTWTVDVKEGDAPKITNKASAAQIDGTGSVNFTVEAEGTNLSYQWYLVKTYDKEPVKNGKYGQIEYAGANTNTLKITCTNAPSTVTSKFICEVSSASSVTAQTEEYTLYITEDPSLSKVKEINVLTKPTKTKYVVGDTLDTRGLEIEVVTGKNRETITEGFACTPILLDTAGVQSITVSFGGKTTVFTVTVEEATHEHEWTAWEKDKSGAERVIRKCKVDDCDAEEAYSFKDFLRLFPVDAAELGIDDNKEKEQDTEKKNDKNSDEKKNNIIDDEIPEDEVTEEKDTSKNSKKDKKDGNGVFWIIIIIALILLAGVSFIYIKFYRTPSKKSQRNSYRNR